MVSEEKMSPLGDALSSFPCLDASFGNRKGICWRCKGFQLFVIWYDSVKAGHVSWCCESSVTNVSFQVAEAETSVD